LLIFKSNSSLTLRLLINVPVKDTASSRIGLQLLTPCNARTVTFKPVSIKKGTRDKYMYCADAYASYPLFVIYLFVPSYLLLIVHLFCSLFDYLVCFHFHWFFAYFCSKEKRTFWSWTVFRYFDPVAGYPLPVKQ
jgi:hypothetical protein